MKIAAIHSNVLLPRSLYLVLDQLQYTRRKGIVFDVSKVSYRDIDVGDIDLDKVESDMFVAFYTGFIEKIGYGGKMYFTEHPQLSNELIDALLDKA